VHYIHTEVMKTKKRKKRPAVVTGGMRMVDQDEWGGAGRGGSDDEGTCVCMFVCNVAREEMEI